jgi:hypothetical protein
MLRHVRRRDGKKTHLRRPPGRRHQEAGGPTIETSRSANAFAYASRSATSGEASRTSAVGDASVESDPRADVAASARRIRAISSPAATVSVCGRSPPYVASTSTRSPGRTAPGGTPAATVTARSPGGTRAATGPPASSSATRVRVSGSPRATSVSNVEPSSVRGSLTAPGGANAAGTDVTRSMDADRLVPRERSSAARTIGTGEPATGSSARSCARDESTRANAATPAQTATTSSAFDPSGHVRRIVPSAAKNRTFRSGEPSEGATPTP